MVNRICISINNRCNLNCSYCHFHEKSTHIQSEEMDVYAILDNAKSHIEKYNIQQFKIGFVGNGEPLLDFDLLHDYIIYIGEHLKKRLISAYTISNGLIATEEMLRFFKEYGVDIGFSIDGIKSVHNALRCNSYDKVMQSIELYRKINGAYPSMNCTVGRDVLANQKETIDFFAQFDNRITFSRMIGKNGISLDSFKAFMNTAMKTLNVRTGRYDCTMYGGMCGAGINNYYFANGKAYICGNCIDLPTPYCSDTPLDLIDFRVNPFDRNCCYKESLK